MLTDAVLDLCNISSKERNTLLASFFRLTFLALPDALPSRLGLCCPWEYPLQGFAVVRSGSVLCS